MMTGAYTKRSAHPKSSAITQRKRQKVNVWATAQRDFDPTKVSRTLSPQFHG